MLLMGGGGMGGIGGNGGGIIPEGIFMRLNSGISCGGSIDGGGLIEGIGRDGGGGMLNGGRSCGIASVS